MEIAEKFIISLGTVTLQVIALVVVCCKNRISCQSLQCYCFKEKKVFLFLGISSGVLLISFYVSLFIFEEIFCRIAWVTFRWIVVLFSFHFHSHKTNYVSIPSSPKNNSRKSCWPNNVWLRLICRLDFCAPCLQFC